MIEPLSELEIITLRKIACERQNEDRTKDASKRFFAAGLKVLDFCHECGKKDNLLWLLGASFRQRMFSFGVNVGRPSPERIKELEQREHKFEFIGTPADASTLVDHNEARLYRGEHLIAILVLNGDAADVLWLDAGLRPRNWQNFANGAPV